VLYALAGQGDDLLYGRKGRDIMKGDTGGQQDTTDGNDQVYGNRGDDWLLGYGATTC
jgi:hypothetical protein